MKEAKVLETYMQDTKLNLQRGVRIMLGEKRYSSAYCHNMLSPYCLQAQTHGAECYAGSSYQYLLTQRAYDNAVRSQGI